jgi:hypothetical protein
MGKRKRKRKLQTLAQAAAEIGVDRATVWRWCREGAPHQRVPLVTGGGIAMVFADDVIAWRAQRENGNTKIHTEIH